MTLDLDWDLFKLRQDAETVAGAFAATQRHPTNAELEEIVKVVQLLAPLLVKKRIVA